jgi:hypothetical protein
MRQQGISTIQIMRLAWREKEAGGIAKGVASGMNLGT